MYSCTSGRLKNMTSATSALLETLYNLQILRSLTRLAFVHKVFICFMLLLPHSRPQNSFVAPPPPLLGATLVSTLGAERRLQRHCLTVLYTIGEMDLGNLDRTPLLRETRALRTCETPNTCVEDQPVKSVPCDAQSLTPTWQSKLWEALKIFRR